MNWNIFWMWIFYNLVLIYCFRLYSCNSGRRHIALLLLSMNKFYLRVLDKTSIMYHSILGLSAFKNPQAFQLHVHVQDEWNWIQPKYCPGMVSAIVYVRDWFSESKKPPFFMMKIILLLHFYFQRWCWVVLFTNL